jgi:hypothetical protein
MMMHVGFETMDINGFVLADSADERVASFEQGQEMKFRGQMDSPD